MTNNSKIKYQTISFSPSIVKHRIYEIFIYNTFYHNLTHVCMNLDLSDI